MHLRSVLRLSSRGPVQSHPWRADHSRSRLPTWWGALAEAGFQKVRLPRRRGLADGSGAAFPRWLPRRRSSRRSGTADGRRKDSGRCRRDGWRKSSWRHRPHPRDSATFPAADAHDPHRPAVPKRRFSKPWTSPCRRHRAVPAWCARLRPGKGYDWG